MGDFPTLEEQMWNNGTRSLEKAIYPPDGRQRLDCMRLNAMYRASSGQGSFDTFAYSISERRTSMVLAHYSGIIEKSQAALSEMSEDHERYTKFIAAHNDADELDNLVKLMSGRPEENIYNLARLEYQHALYALSFAQYRQAHVSLRLFMELSLSGILFSAHEIDTHLWLKGQKDSNWSSIISNENGVFSKSFVGAFFEDMKEFCSEYLAMAKAVYRECSEFVHGNRSSFDGIDSEIKYHNEIADKWLDRADTVRILVKFAFLTRYLPHASASTKNEFEQMAIEQFGTLPPIQAMYSGATS